MNDELIRKKILNNLLDDLTYNELFYVINNNSLKKELIDIIIKNGSVPIDWKNWFDDESLVRGNEDFFDVFFYYSFMDEEVNNYGFYQKIILENYNFFLNSFPLTRKKIDDDTRKYFDKLVLFVENNDNGIIDNPFIIKYYINKNNTKMFRRLNYDRVKLSSEEVDCLINYYVSPSKEFKYFISNSQLIDYIIDHDMYDLYRYVFFDKYSFNDSRIAKYVDFLCQNTNNFKSASISHLQVIDYILNNSMEQLYAYIDFNKITSFKGDFSRVIDALRVSHDSGFWFAADIYSTDIVKYVIENDISDLYDCLNVDRCVIPDNLVPKVVELIKMRELDVYSITNHKLIDYIVENEEEELYGFIMQFKLNNNLDFTKENLFKMKKIIKFDSNVAQDFPIISYLLDESEEDIDKFFELIKIRDLSINDLKNVNESLQQAIFRQNNPDVVNIFNTIKQVTENKDMSLDEKKQLSMNWVNLFLGEDCIPNYLINDFKNKNNHFSLIEKKRLFLEEIIYKVVLEKQFVPYLDLLHEITDYYVAKKANDYSTENGIDIIKVVTYDYDILDNKREINRKIFNYLNKTNHEFLMNILKDNGYLYDDISGKQFKEARAIFLKWIGNTINKEGNNSMLPQELHYLFNDSDFTSNLKKNIRYEKRKMKLNEMNEVFSIDELNVIFDFIIDDEKKYRKLWDIITKYKFLEWPLVFKEHILKLFGEEFCDLFSFISCFDGIYDKNNDKYISDFFQSDDYQDILNKYSDMGYDLGDIKALEIINKELIHEIDGKFQMRPYKLLSDYYTYSSCNLVYKLLLGNEAYSLIKSNPPKNCASKKKNETQSSFVKDRLEKAILCYINSLKLHDVTIPSFSKVLSLSNGKKIKVIVGNRTSPRNLVLGEMTGSCMRIRGLGAALFDFCNSDPRGFHIVFEDPDNGKMVSRISGYRNGNTVFLNQLRDSLLLGFTNNDLVEALKIVSNDIIEESNKPNNYEEMPIENVVADCDYALSSCESIEFPLTFNEFTLPKYSDVGVHRVVILATTSKDNTLQPIELNEKYQSVYKAVRTEPKIIDGFDKEVSNYIYRIRLIKECLASDDVNMFKHLGFEDEKIDVKKAIVSDDWVIYLNNDNEIEVINASTDERAEKEIEEAVKILNDELNLVNRKRRK